MKKYIDGKYAEMTPEEITEFENELKLSKADVINAKVQELKQKLAETDYIACKIAEGSATKEEYAEQISQRQLWREEINELLLK